MIAALLVAAALAAQKDHAPPPRPKAPKAVVKPKPPPPPPEDLEDDDPPDLPDAPEDLDVGDAPPQPSKPELTDEQAGAVGLASLCCCFLGVAALIGFIVWLVRRSSAASQPKAAVAPPSPVTSATMPPAPGAIPFHLSVFALGLRAPARQQVAQALILGGAQADPTTAADRTHLVRELAKALAGLEPEWSHFGYGERLDLTDDPSAAKSYQLAVDDFTRRSAQSSSSQDSTYAVVTLVLCTRRQLRGISALDDRSQIRALLQDRAVLLETELMGAYIVWSLPLGGHEVLTRFPEMHAIA